MKYQSQEPLLATKIRLNNVQSVLVIFLVLTLTASITIGPLSLI